jgi:hypothetical protein
VKSLPHRLSWGVGCGGQRLTRGGGSCAGGLPSDGRRCFGTYGRGVEPTNEFNRWGGFASGLLGGWLCATLVYMYGDEFVRALASYTVLPWKSVINAPGFTTPGVPPREGVDWAGGRANNSSLSIAPRIQAHSRLLRLALSAPGHD